MKAIRVNEHGGPEALSYEDVEVAEPGPGEARVRTAASGVNFIDVYMRSGVYPGEPPFTLGLEGAGEVEAVGEGVEDVSIGDYVAWAGAPGSYAEAVVAPADKLVPFNVTMVEARVAAAIMLQGMTAHYLTHSTFPLEEGHTALVHAAAGGVGLLLCQMAKMRGATVIGTAGTEEKARLAREAGADEVILYAGPQPEGRPLRHPPGARPVHPHPRGAAVARGEPVLLDRPGQPRRPHRRLLRPRGRGPGPRGPRRSPHHRQADPDPLT